MNKYFLILSIFISFFFLVSPLVSAEILTWDNSKTNTTSTYDAKGRILANSDISYTYDIEKNNTLTNITNTDSTIKYEYDNKGRITKETKIIDGFTFTKEFSYDSMNRLILLDGISYVYGEDGNINSIDGMINITYNENLQISEREYENGKITLFDYYNDNFRLQRILTGNDSIKESASLSYVEISGDADPSSMNFSLLKPDILINDFPAEVEFECIVESNSGIKNVSLEFFENGTWEVQNNSEFENFLIGQDLTEKSTTSSSAILVKTLNLDDYVSYVSSDVSGESNPGSCPRMYYKFTYDDETSNSVSTFPLVTYPSFTTRIIQNPYPEKIVQKIEVFIYRYIACSSTYDTYEKNTKIYQERIFVDYIENATINSTTEWRCSSCNMYESCESSSLNRNAGMGEDYEINSSQAIRYNYDSFGNILGIFELANNRIFNINYDNLNRLKDVIINSNNSNSIINYTFNSIGNIMEVEENDIKTVYEYSDQKIHAPSMIVSEDEIDINITYPTNSSDFVSELMNMTWVTLGNFSSNLLTYIIDYSIDGGLNWSNIVNDLGFTNEFNDSSNNKMLNMSSEETKTVYLKIPKNTKVNRAEIKVGGVI